MSDIFHEINDEMRQKQIKEFWDVNKNWIIGSAIAAVLLTAGLTFWRGYEHRQNVEQTSALLAAVKTEDPASIMSFANDGAKNHAVMAQFSAASLLLKENKPLEALKIYEEIEDTSGIDSTWRDLATLLSVGQRFETEKPKKLRDDLEDLLEDGNTWRFSAQELDGLLLAREGKVKQAAAQFTVLSADPNAPEDVRMRARTLRELYLGMIENKSE